MKVPFLITLGLITVINGRAVLIDDGFIEPSADTTLGILSASSRTMAVDLAFERAKAKYGKEFGYSGATRNVVLSTTGQQLLYVVMKGDGDCAFHSLGIARSEMLSRLETYIRDNEKLSTTINQTNYVEYVNLSDILGGYQANIQEQNLQFKKLDFSDKAKRLKALVDASTTKTEQSKRDADNNIQQLITYIQAEQLKEQPDWDTLQDRMDQLIATFDQATDDLKKVYLYKDFLQKCEADFWKSIGNDRFVSAISQFMRETKKIGGAADETLMDILSNTTIDDITPYLDALKEYIKKGNATLSDPQVESINFKLRFAKADLNEKLRIIRRFYGVYGETTYADGTKVIGRREWLDPSAIIFIADQLNLKLLLYKKEIDKAKKQTGRYVVRAQSPNATKPGKPSLRRIYHTGGHYDMLAPIMPDDEVSE